MQDTSAQQILSEWDRNTTRIFGTKGASIRLLIEKEQIEAFHLFAGDGKTETGGEQGNKFS